MDSLKRFVALCCCLTVSSPIGAQDELSRVVDGLQAKYRRLQTLSADFTQVYTARGERTRRESGRLLLKKPGKMRWDYTSPEAKLFVSDGRVIVEYVPSEKVATRTRVKESSDLRAPFMFLLGRGDLRRDFSKIEWANEAPTHAGNRVLRLIPKRAGEFRELMLEIDLATLQLARLSFIESDGARSDFSFTNLRENPPASDLQFRFEPPEGVQVID
ncbi:MAG: outer membrane lipoprotein chaperone LolA [Acidobacteriota bacterium]